VRRTGSYLRDFRSSSLVGKIRDVLIILEGPDGSGKTTLANDVSRVLERSSAHVTTLRAGPPVKPNPLDEYEVPLAGYRPGDTHVICDRWHLGEAVYPAILGRTSKWDVAVERHIYLFLKSRGACVVLLKSDVLELTTRIMARGDDLIDVNQLDAIIKGYDELNRAHFFHVYTDAVLATPLIILSAARRMHLAASRLRNFITYVGSTHPNTLLLGDVRADRALLKYPSLPAFMPYPSTSGHFLLKHLDVIKHNVGLANACDADDPVQLWKILRMPPIVTLGRRAHDRLEKLGVQHGAVPHPQFVRRFHHNHGDAYADIIQKARNTQEDMLSWRP
jgi:thymidylate kinase